MGTTELLLKILCSEVNGEEINTESFCEYDAKELYKIARNQDFLYCVTNALNKVGALPEDKKMRDAFLEAQIVSVARIVQIEEVTKQIRDILNKAKIPFAPLKGTRIRSMYPDKMMRTSCDIDILIREAELEQAITALTEAGFTTSGKRHYHDVSLFFGNVHLELHFNICEGIDGIDSLLSRVWEFTEPVSQYEYAENPEFFAYHHLAHMVYHFVNGDCGIRPFLDLFIMRKKAFYDESKLISLLETVGLTTFYNSALELISVWFDKSTHTKLTKQCEDYIACGCIYGSWGNSIAADTIIRKGRLGYVIHEMFPQYSSMCILYPNLKNAKILLPLYYIDRILKKNTKQSWKKLKLLLSKKQKDADAASRLLNELGLETLV